jgi:hypothetical protein
VAPGNTSPAPARTTVSPRALTLDARHLLAYPWPERSRLANAMERVVLLSNTEAIAECWTSSPTTLRRA